MYTRSYTKKKKERKGNHNVAKSSVSNLENIQSSRKEGKGEEKAEIQNITESSRKLKRGITTKNIYEIL